MLLHSDGLAEAHNERREMFGFDRLARLVAQAESGQQLIDRCLSELERFTGPGVEQEDDITLVALERAPASGFGSDEGVGEMPVDVNAPPEAWRVLDEFSLASEPGNERAALQRVAEAVAPLGLSGTTLERLKTAVAETTMNAIEHGNGNRPELPVEVQVTTDGANVAVSVTDLGGHDAAAVPPTETPDLDAKLAGTQTPRGWGLFLIRHMVDEMDVATDGARHTVRLVVDFGSDRDRGGGFDDEQV
jgi:anti-sigma regulatory factor (Ser/Thr protein kinase)